MTIYDILKDIILSDVDSITDDIEFNKEFSPFLVQRWLSMQDEDYSLILNNTTNILSPVLDDKKMWYNYFKVLLPKCSYIKIKYIKKIKKDKKKKDNYNEIVELLADRLEMSKKEVAKNIEDGNIDIRKIEKEYLGLNET